MPAIATMLMATIGASCCPKATTQETATEETILVASGGGFSGVYSGYLLRRDGTVQAWTQGPGGADSVRTLIVLHPDTTDYLFARIRFIGFKSMEVSSPGNLTYLVRVTAADGSHETRWGDRSYTPAGSLVRYYEEFLALIKERLGLQ